MRAILLAGVLPVFVAACSERAAEPQLGREEEAILSARLELALAAADGGSTPVATAAEIDLPKPKPERPRTSSARRKVAPVASTPPAEVMEVEVQHDHAVSPEPDPTLVGTVLNPKVDDEPVSSGPSVQPTAEPAAPASGGGRGKPLPGDIDTGRGGRAPGVIIIRGGGGGGGHDPCRVHPPRGGRGGVGGMGGIIGEEIGGRIGGDIGAMIGRGAAGVLINERVPRTGRGTTPYPRGGIRF